MTAWLPLHGNRTVMVCGRCFNPSCQQWFTAPMLLSQLGAAHRGSDQAIPMFCSKRCSRNRQEARRRYRDREGREMQNAAARIAAAELCPACWTRRVARGGFQRVLCTPCMASVESMCRGKARRGSPGNADRVAGARGSWTGRDMDAYQCRFCNWWHVGGAVDRRRAKQLTFLVETFLSRAPAELVERLRNEYAPGRATKYGPRVRLVK